MFRITEILFLVGGLLQVGSALLNLAFPEAIKGARGWSDDEVVTYMVAAILVTVAITGAAFAWIHVTDRRWQRRDPRGLRHAKGIGILLIVLGAIGVLSGLGELGVLEVSTTVNIVHSTMAVTAWAISGATLVFGILILRSRGKPDARAAFERPTRSV